MLAGFLFLSALPVRAATYFVDGASPNCSDSGSGSSSTPYCTITKAVTTRGGPDVQILVSPAVYREMVVIPASGTSATPFEIRASGGTPTIDGADDFGSPSEWSLQSGNVWRASGVAWSPKQVFVDGARLVGSSASPSSLPANSFTYVSGDGLYVNIGGPNPGSRAILVGRRSSGFTMSGRSWVRIDGFTILHTEDRSVYFSGSSHDCELTNSTIALSGGYGLSISSSQRIFVSGLIASNGADHGVIVSSGSSECTIQDSESFGNARPAVKAANGINVSGATSNLIQRNRLHDNQDTGLQFSSGANNNTSIQNRSWNNGDHGFDHYSNSTGNTHIGDDSFHNFKDGFSIEGASPNTTLIDCISVDNGLTTGEFDLWIDSSSQPGFVSNSNIFWNSTSVPPFKYVDTTYTSLASYVARSGQDTRSLQANPRFQDAAHGDFHLTAGSPAIDSADSTPSVWPVTDAEGAARIDDAGASNTGLGPPFTYADRGALEYASATPANQAPDGGITSPSGNATITAGGSVSFTGSGSDPDGNTPLSYSWTFGGAAPDSASASPGSVTFPTAGVYVVTFTVRDSLGLADPSPDTRTITVSSAGQGGTTVEKRIGASSDDAEDRVSSTSLSSSDLELTFDGLTQVVGLRFTSLAIPRGSQISAAWVQFKAKETQSDATALLIQGQAIDDAPTFTSAGANVSGRARTIASKSWVPAAWSTSGEAGSKQRTPDLSPIIQEIVSRSGWSSGRSLALIISGTGHRTPYAWDGDHASAPLLHVEFGGGGAQNQAPNGTIDTPAGNMSISAGRSVSFSSSGTDADANTPLSFQWDFGGGAPSSGVEDPGNVTFISPGTYTVTLIVRDSLGLADPTPDTRIITVNSTSGGSLGSNLVGNPSFESGTSGWQAYGSDTIAVVAGGTDGTSCLEMRAGSSTSEFGVNDTPSWVTSSGPAGTTYRITAFVRSASSRGSAKLRIREYQGSSQVGSIYTPAVTLSTSWQPVTVQYVTSRTNSSLDLQILDYPVTSREIFQTDSVSIQIVP